MSSESQNLRHQLDGPMRKVREDLGLPPLESRPLISQELPEFPSAILEHSGKLTGEMVEAIRRHFERLHATPTNAHKLPIILDRGMTLSTGPR